MSDEHTAGSAKAVDFVRARGGPVSLPWMEGRAPLRAGAEDYRQHRSGPSQPPAPPLPRPDPQEAPAMTTERGPGPVGRNNNAASRVRQWLAECEGPMTRKGLKEKIAADLGLQVVTVRDVMTRLGKRGEIRTHTEDGADCHALKPGALVSYEGTPQTFTYPETEGVTLTPDGPFVPVDPEKVPELQKEVPEAMERPAQEAAVERLPAGYYYADGEGAYHLVQDYAEVVKSRDDALERAARLSGIVSRIGRLVEAGATQSTEDWRERCKVHVEALREALQ